MAKVIKYSIRTLVTHDDGETPWVEEVLSPVTMGWNEKSEEVAKREAFNGIYTIENEIDMED